MEDKIIYFSDIIGMEKRSNSFEVKLKNGESLTELLGSTDKFVDPSFDSIFQNIFCEGNSINNKSGKERLINLLNSLIFPNEKEIKFINISFTSNQNNLLTIGKKGGFRFDILCKATIYDNKKAKSLILDVEMQLFKDKNMIERFFKYCSSISKQNEENTLVIVFINNNEKINYYNRSQYIQLISNQPNGAKDKTLDFFGIYFINLKEEIEKIMKNEKIYIKQKELDENGICWIKLLGIRHWGIQNDHRYFMPKNINFPSEEIKTAFIMLEQINDTQLNALLNDEEFMASYERTCRKDAVMEFMLSKLVKSFRKDKNKFEDFIDLMVEEDTKIDEKDIKILIRDNSELKEFCNLLGKKRKIIYDKDINKC